MAVRTVRATTVTQGNMASIPAQIRKKFDVRPGDQLLWEASGNTIRLRVLHHRGQGFADFEPVDLGYPTDGNQEHDEVV